jgi:pyruvate, orthophosphate dikinase
VTVQRMIFGNAGGDSGSGVGFTRDPASGENRLYLDFLFNAQGEDVVSGRRVSADPAMLERLLPEVHIQVEALRGKLETEFGDAQEFEFTVQERTLFLLQTRTAKRTPLAELRIAVDQVNERLITPQQGLARLANIDIDSVEEIEVAPAESTTIIGRATTASVGVVAGPIALDSTAAAKLSKKGSGAILVRQDTTTEDIAGIAAAAGLLTAIGGRTSHAAVVARQMNKVCLVGCADLAIDLPQRRCRIGSTWFKEGDFICLDANSGSIFPGQLRTKRSRPQTLLDEVARWRELKS